jgi:[FeFe] hydrogenase H-cluster maturation GTPase HydF
MPVRAERPHIVIYGITNSGKSTLFNALTETQTAIVSDVAGTTTDPVYKTMELTGYGPVVVVDTAGFGDDTPLGAERLKKTLRTLDFADFALLCSDERINLFTGKNIPYHIAKQPYDIEVIKNILVEHLSKKKQTSEDMLRGLLPCGAFVVAVTPLDSAAPANRLILPQSRLIRDCLDNGLCCTVCTPDNLQNVLDNVNNISLIVTDSQAFKEVSNIIPSEMPLTSFSILMSRQKGDLNKLLDGIKTIETLNDGDKILIAESCTHSTTHEDIGQVKIPLALKNKTKKDFDYTFVSGRDFPEDISEYKLTVHCGGCMMSRLEFINRQDKGVPMTNYGMVLAWASGILERSVHIFKKNE